MTDATLPGDGLLPADAQMLAVPEQAQPAPAAQATVLALLTAHDRQHNTLVQHRVTRWPVLVGRALHCDWVIDDPHLAPEHVRIAPNAQGQLQIELLASLNGLRLGRQQLGTGDSAIWEVNQALSLGKLQLHARQASDSVLPEQTLHRGWRIWLGHNLATAVALVLLALYTLVASWLPAMESGMWAAVVGGLLALGAGIATWSGLWALASKLFGGRLWFARHVQIAAVGLALMYGIGLVGNVLAFAFSWSTLAKFDNHVAALMLAAMVWYHLRYVLSVPPRRLAMVVGCLAIAGLAIKMGFDWQSQKRLSSKLYMSSFFPPSWRLAQPVNTQQWLLEMDTLKPRLNQRLQDQSDDSAQDYNELD